ncbi:ImmA/IrrE family metallo-endopeptidase [Streptococcus porcinus]|uniref:ImmA/IrrE family metallo-endopeptidase n=1 Tax=Streptococcus porcinus TaxID=1340 RepID=A0A7V9WTH3_STRPO|nr:ImmA/IrrE family metallo-endopeptidase [Streptococcus porcinus]MBA2796598.1 ImmA/IrrE family metallo-endopeptidase [Streptococcus porcinus]
MTPKVLFIDGREIDNKGFYIHQANVIIMDAYLDEIDKKKVLYHESEHQNHLPENYERLREKYEQMSDRNMIHYLLKEYLPTLDNIEDFNICRFMETYRLKTIANEAMVIEEFKNLI